MSLKDSKSKAIEAYGTARERAIEAYDSARDSARNAGRKAGDGIQDAPLLALGGGLALGLLIGALLPRSEREKRALRGVGGEINNRTRSAISAAKEAGKATLDERGLTSDAATNVVRDVMKGLGAAAKSSAEAATKAVRDEE